MPTYEYKCSACGHAFEKFHSIMADPIKECPVCKKKKVKRLIGMGSALIFKGSGFYTTDYRSDGYKAQASGDSKPSDSKPGESKAGDPKASETKNGDSKSGGDSAKAVPAPAVPPVATKAPAAAPTPD